MLSKRSSCERVDPAESPARRVHPFFNRTLFFKNVTRFWPIWLCYTVIWAFCLPAQIFVDMIQANRYGWPVSDLLYWSEHTILSLTSSMGVGLSLIFGLLAAVAVFSYLFSARSAGLMHTLPIRREGLFFTNYLSGLAFLWIPNLLVALLTFAAEAAAGVLVTWNIVLWLLIQCGTCFFFYTFAVLCGMFTGNIIAMPVFYGIFNCLAMVIYAILDVVLDLFLFGYNGFDFGDALMQWLTPVVKLVDELHFRTAVENGVDVRLFTGFQYVLAYCGVALIFLICSLYLYESRHIESAGDVIAVPWAKPVFKFGFAFCAGLCGGVMLYYTFGTLFETTKVVFILFCLLAGVVGCFVADMLLQKSFKVFRKKNWISCGIFSICLALLLTGLTNDVFGTETKVPDPDRVTSVELNGTSLPPYDSACGNVIFSDEAEIIGRVVALHQGIVNDLAFYKAYDQNSSLPYRDGYISSDWEYGWLNIHYTLADGSSLSRSYRIPFNISTQTPDANSVEGIFLALMNDTDHLLDSYFPSKALNARPSSGCLYVFNIVSNEYEEVTFTAEQAAILAEAALEDVLAGRLGIHYLSDYSPQRRENCSYRDLELEWVYTASSSTSSASASTSVTQGSSFNSRTWNSSITPQFTATSLMRALNELGILDATHILPSYADLDSEIGLDQIDKYWDMEKEAYVYHTT